MPKKNYQVFLTDDDITVLNNIRKNGHSSAKTIMHANILLNTNDSFPEKKKSNRELSEIFGVSLPTVNKIRKTYCEEGLAAALNRKTRLTPETMSKITGEFEAHVIATALSLPRKAMQSGTCAFWLSTAWKRNILYPYHIQLSEQYLIQTS